MNDEQFDKLLASVNQADSIINGKKMPSRISQFDDIEVKTIRAKTGLSQVRFASVLGVSKRTLENWEQGRRQPTGPARALLKIVNADPVHAIKTLNI